jgi:hypothetical protein
LFLMQNKKISKIILKCFKYKLCSYLKVVLEII